MYSRTIKLTPLLFKLNQTSHSFFTFYDLLEDDSFLAWMSPPKNNKNPVTLSQLPNLAQYDNDEHKHKETNTSTTNSFVKSLGISKLYSEPKLDQNTNPYINPDPNQTKT